jgi:hypothetical protein
MIDFVQIYKDLCEKYPLPDPEIVLNEAFSAIESHDLKFSSFHFCGSEERRKQVLEDLKNWK